MSRLYLLALVAGCGFQANNGGQQQPNDAAPSTDAVVSSDAPMTDAGADAMADAPTGAQCPAGYDTIAALGNSASRYRFVSTQLAWIDAERDCEDDGDMMQRPTHLIVLDSVAEKTAMITGLLGTVAINDQWIGLTDLDEEGEFEYVTNQAATYSATPTGNADNKDCVRIKESGAEETRSCAETNKFVCECDANRAAPSQFPNPPDGNNGD
ncbi:MAG: C-type lectin domain-containing protein [Deltaproteobacteria bacterium]|nr:C-type lectin domain-containing protein [Deltaproteobacteria bacterium]